MNTSAKVFPGFWFAALLCMIALGIQTALIIPFAVVGIVTKLPLVSHPAVLGGVNVLAFAGTLMAGWLMGRVPPREWLPLRPVPWALYPVVALTCIGAVILLSEADNLLRMVLPMPKYLEEMFRQMFATKQNPIAAFVLLVVVAPVTEEVLFRGMILRGFRTRYSTRMAVVASAFLFGCLHANPWQFIGAFGLGLIFGWWLLRTGCLWLCVLGHAVANGSLFLAGFLPWDIPGLTVPEGTALPSTLQPWWLDLSGASLMVLGLWLFHLLAPRSPFDAAPPQASGAPPPSPPPLLET
jgi:membrane protease YdiL (CAAX protease family)